MANVICRYDDYYGNNPAQQLAQKMKKNDGEATRIIAKDLADLIYDGCTLIPIPCRIGIPIATLALARLLEDNLRETKKLNIEVSPILFGCYRESLYHCKKEGRSLHEAELGFHLAASAAVPQGKKIYLVDNVLATGLTAAAALRLFPQGDILVHSVDKKTFQQSVYRERFDRIITNVPQQQLKQEQKQKLRNRL